MENKNVLRIKFNIITQVSKVKSKKLSTKLIVDNMECDTSKTREQFSTIYCIKEEMLTLKVKEEIKVNHIYEYVKD